jgi:hypothetical protein
MSFSIKSSAQVENPSQTQKVTNYLTEVYTNCPQYVDSIHIARGIEILSRIQIHIVEENQYPECLLLSSVALKNKCNPSLSYDQSNFNFETFNPFKYLFAFYSTQTAYFRVDGTNYIIEIKPIK